MLFAGVGEIYQPRLLALFDRFSCFVVGLWHLSTKRLLALSPSCYQLIIHTCVCMNSIGMKSVPQLEKLLKRLITATCNLKDITRSDFV
jgi:hypothetical protein